MPAAVTAQQRADRTARALAAATAAGRDLGLDVGAATVLHDAFSVVVHLSPSPVVVRVPTVLPGGTDVETQAARQRSELDVVAWLAEQGVPVVAPSPLVPREPVRRDGFSMTCWQLVEHDTTAEPDYLDRCRLVADLHLALRGYPGALPFLDAVDLGMITRGLADLAELPELLTPADLERAHREWDVLAPLVRSRQEFEAAFPGVGIQPIHGDAPAVNILTTPGGDLFADFELATSGPVEWDLAFLGADAAATYDAAARALGLRTLDDRVLRLVDAIGVLRSVACLALAPQLPMLAEAVAPVLDRWRDGPFAGGFER
ncbi:phosphotransferase [Saccharopolyspora sp. 7B]|uniref:phosphotransferase n=1 Tax=Saccharopolyspora sp. 7B TaxID=2877240 RepID=UPI001CD572B6|nr:phosphotransferase [Saccharopolyspora sp. 7B]MCA1282915.1 phosphotransferase [Saccharopolyspora sp. 7B]